ncbi:hypothetical protein FACS189490_08400 [Clostridia bacterium]|nr:hypothetical protein FACS189490_08400 [Clostridia bacterium]
MRVENTKNYNRPSSNRTVLNYRAKKAKESIEAAPEIAYNFLTSDRDFSLTAAKESALDGENGRELAVSAQNAGRGQFFVKIKIADEPPKS